MVFAYFISDHGFGHAARSCAVMEAISELRPGAHFEIFSRTPGWFFDQSLKASFNLNSETTDVGLLQTSPFNADLTGTIEALDGFLPFSRNHIERLTGLIRDKQCKAVLCDISPLGIAVARSADLPSVLLENFTWEWLYEDFPEVDKRFTRVIGLLRSLTDQADYHVLLKPYCHPYPANYVAPPVSRRPRLSKNRVRARLEVPDNVALVLICMGGVAEKRFEYLRSLRQQPAHYFIVPGAAERFTRGDNVILLPHHSDFYHPDLIHAANLAVGKLGYSTLAEVYSAGIPYFFVTRLESRETVPLAKFVSENMTGAPLTQATFQSADWLSMLPDFLDMPRRQLEQPEGRESVARFLLNIGSN